MTDSTEVLIGKLAADGRTETHGEPPLPAWTPLIRGEKFDLAIELLEAHLQGDPNDANAWEDLGVALARQRRFVETKTKFQTALDINPDRAGTWRNLGRVYGDLESLADAERCLLEVVRLEPHSVDNQKALSRLYQRMRHHDDAIKAMQKAAVLAPDSFDLHHDLGRMLADAKRYSDAKTTYLRALDLDSTSSDLCNNLGVACHELGEHDEAIKHFREAIRLRPSVAGVYNNLGIALNEQRHFQDATDCFNKAIAINPEYALAWNNLGNSLRALGRNEAAIAAFETAIRLKHDYPEAFNNIAIVYVQTGENEKALAWYDKALGFRPDYPECHMNRALQRLLLGDFANGWADYEWRWHLKTMRHRDLKKPLWDGSPLGGKRILIYWEQGLGDSIQFIRYAKELKDRGATVVFEGQPVLQHLLSRTPGLDQFIPRGSELPPFDVHAPLLSLPGQCHTTLENIPSDVPYILPDPYFVNLWKPRLDAVKGFRVGIVWQGNPDHRGDHLRSFPLRLFEPLARIEGVTLISLQKSHGCGQLAELNGLFEVTTFDGVDEDADGFVRTAAIIKNLDLVIAADTSVAHLAGAMGVPAWVVISVATDWRWLRQREDSPWYPTIRLFRQKEPGNWTEVFSRLAEALADRVAATPRRLLQIMPSDRRKARQFVKDAGKHLKDNRSTEEAQKLLEQAIQCDPELADAHHDLAVVFGRQKQILRSIASFRRAIELKPMSPSAYGNIGLAFLQNKQDKEAIAHLRKAIRLGGGSAEVYNHLGVALMNLPDPAAAEGFYIKALHLRPDFAAAHCNLARCLLLQGKYQQGWLESEWRFKASSQMVREFTRPRWTGESLRNKTLLLWLEEGASGSDAIQFIRYAVLLKQRGARVVVQCLASLVPLMSRCTGVAHVVPSSPDLPKFDVHAALLSLPTILATTLNSIPAPIPYLTPDPALVQKWRRIRETDGLKVAIAWGTDSQLDLSGEGSIPIGTFGRLGQIRGVKLMSVQTGSHRRHLAKLADRLNVEDIGAQLEQCADPFLELAACMYNMDLVITTDTAVAHLAGAMGINVWIALPAAPHCRWLLDREDSPWYPTMRIFRQIPGGKWSNVFENIATELVERVTHVVHDSHGKSLEASAETLHDEACRYFSRGQLASAIERFEQAVALNPNWSIAHHDLAVAYAKRRSFDHAIRHFRRALELDPSSKGYENLSLALLERGDLESATQELQGLVHLKPESPDLNCRLGIALVRSHRHADAELYLQRAVELQPQSADARFWIGQAQRHLKKTDLALESFKRVLELRPEWHEGHNALGLCLATEQRYDDAVNAFRRTVQLKPDFVEAWNNLAIAFSDSNRLAEATDAFQHALYLRPDSADTHRNLAITLLLQGKYEQGWLEYEWRLRVKDAPKRKLPGRRWDGSTLKGKTLLMTTEQGLGDTIQFLRFAKLAKEQGATTIVECQPPLQPLLCRCPFIDETICAGGKTRSADFHVPLMSLPVGFRTTLETIPHSTPYLFPDPQLKMKWAARLPENGKFRVGIAWQGNRSYGGDRHRSIPLAEFRPLSVVANLQLISLQKGWGTEQITDASVSVHEIAGFADPTINFDDTAAIIENLDAIVCCDTSVGHLAAALGMPVYLALSTANDWRWLRDRGDSPWYPTVRLFRQDVPGQWHTVFEQISTALSFDSKRKMEQVKAL